VWARAEGFWQPEQDELTEPYVERFFREIPDAARLRGDRVLETMLIFLYPRFAATRHTLDLAAELLARDDLSVPLRTRTIDFTDDLRRVVEARETGA
jgi:aminopeptidase N